MTRSGVIGVSRSRTPVSRATALPIAGATTVTGICGMTVTVNFFAQNHLPAWLAWFDISFEVVVTACLILGLYAPLVCIVSLPILVASMIIFSGNGFYFPTGGIELPILWALAQIVLALLGPGRWRVSPPVWLPRLPGVPGLAPSGSAS